MTFKNILSENIFRKTFLENQFYIRKNVFQKLFLNSEKYFSKVKNQLQKIFSVNIFGHLSSASGIHFLQAIFRNQFLKCLILHTKPKRLNQKSLTSSHQEHPLPKNSTLHHEPATTQLETVQPPQLLLPFNNLSSGNSGISKM